MNFGRFYASGSEKGYTDYPFSKEFLEQTNGHAKV